MAQLCPSTEFFYSSNIYSQIPESRHTDTDDDKFAYFSKQQSVGCNETQKLSNFCDSGPSVTASSPTCVSATRRLFDRLNFRRLSVAARQNRKLSTHVRRNYVSKSSSFKYKPALQAFNGFSNPQDVLEALNVSNISCAKSRQLLDHYVYPCDFVDDKGNFCVSNGSHKYKLQNLNKQKLCTVEDYSDVTEASTSDGQQSSIEEPLSLPWKLSSEADLHIPVECYSDPYDNYSAETCVYTGISDFIKNRTNSDTLLDNLSTNSSRKSSVLSSNLFTSASHSTSSLSDTKCLCSKNGSSCETMCNLSIASSSVNTANDMPVSINSCKSLCSDVVSGYIPTETCANFLQSNDVAYVNLPQMISQMKVAEQNAREESMHSNVSSRNQLSRSAYKDGSLEGNHIRYLESHQKTTHKSSEIIVKPVNTVSYCANGLPTTCASHLSYISQHLQRTDEILNTSHLKLSQCSPNACQCSPSHTCCQVSRRCLHHSLNDCQHAGHGAATDSSSAVHQSTVSAYTHPPLVSRMSGCSRNHNHHNRNRSNVTSVDSGISVEFACNPSDSDASPVTQANDYNSALSKTLCLAGYIETVDDELWVLQKKDSTSQNFVCDINQPLCKQRWYHGAITRKQSERLLKGTKRGSFLVRFSESSLFDYSLSMKLVHGIAHMKMKHDASSNKYIIGQFSRPFPSIVHIVHYYSLHTLPIKGVEHLTLKYPVLTNLD